MSVLIALLLPYLLTPLYLVVTPVSTLMVWRYVTFQPVTRIWRPLEDIAPVLPRTVIASEDAQFCNHRGIDWRGLRDIIQEAEDLEDLRGGSTITQQTAKNLFLWQGRSYVRKALEMPLAVWMDLILGKRRIMEIYLNVAEWGPSGQFGAEAGARRAFKTSAADLDARQAALMAAMLPNPRAPGCPEAGTGGPPAGGDLPAPGQFRRARRLPEAGAPRVREGRPKP